MIYFVSIIFDIVILRCTGSRDGLAFCEIVSCIFIPHDGCENVEFGVFKVGFTVSIKDGGMYLLDSVFSNLNLPSPKLDLEISIIIMGMQ